MVKHGHRRPTCAQKAAETKRLKDAEKIFLEFHENTSWAHDKVRSGTAALTEEAVRFMQDELVRRKDIKTHEDRLAADNAALDLAAKVQANKEAEL